MHRMAATGFVVCAVMLVAADAPKDPNVKALEAKGLLRSGAAFVLAEEKVVLEGMKGLRQARGAAERETSRRKAAEARIAANQKLIKDGTKEFKELEKRLPKMKDVSIHNRTVTRMNALADRVKGAIEGQKDLEEEANKISAEAKTKFIEELTALAPKVDAAAAKYKALAADAGVKSAVAKLNAGANPKVSIGPSPEFNRAIDDVATWRSQIESEAIPMRDDGGVFSIEAVVNGERIRMLVDTGASYVTLPFEVAKKVGLTPGEQDPTVQMKLANGAVIDGKLMSLKTVRVGRFTVDNCACVVFQEGLTDAATILGGSYLSHFVVKMNQSTRELHLTEVGEGKTTAGASGVNSSDADGQ